MSCKHGNADWELDRCELCAEEGAMCKREFEAGRQSVFDELKSTGTIVEASQDEELAALRAERDKLIDAVADHVTVRCEQAERIRQLDELCGTLTEQALLTFNREAELAARVQALREALARIERGSNTRLQVRDIARKALAALGRAEERERCAKVCDDLYVAGTWGPESDFADAIRALKDDE